MNKELYFKPATKANKVMMPLMLTTVSTEDLGISTASATEGPDVVGPSLAELEAWGDANFRHDGFKDDTKIW